MDNPFSPFSIDVEDMEKKRLMLIDLRLQVALRQCHSSSLNASNAIE